MSNARHLLVRYGEGRLPETLLVSLRDEVVLSGWLRGTGVLADVVLSGGRRLGGQWQAVVLDANLGFSGGDVTARIRAVLTRETDTGIETVAGEITESRIVSFEALITALDEVSTQAQAPAPAPPPAPAPAPAPAPSLASAPPPAVAPAPTPTQQPRPSPTFSLQNPIPARIKPAAKAEEADQPVPEPGDLVEHFAFGRCEVVKSEGDRLHVRLGKDGRIKEIALEMLKVTALPPVEGATGNHYRLDRRM